MPEILKAPVWLAKQGWSDEEFTEMNAAWVKHQAEHPDEVFVWPPMPEAQ